MIPISQNAVKRGIIKSHMQFVEKNSVPVALFSFVCDLPPSSDETLESMVTIVQEQTDFSTLLLCEDGALLTFIKGVQLHRSVEIVKNLQETLRKELGIEMAYGALTLVEGGEEYDVLIARLKRYLAQAKSMGEGKICYGTAKYDFCVDGGEEKIFADFFEAYDTVTLYNFYNGMPLSEEVKVLSYQDGVLRIKTSFARAIFLQNEPFTFLKHPRLPDTIKADIVQALPNRAEVVLSHFRFVDKSPVDRENIRITPDEKIEVSIECANGEHLIGTIHSLAVNSIAIKMVDTKMTEECFEKENRHNILSFELPEREGQKVEMRISALLRGKKDDQLIFSIYPNYFFKQKIESYIALQQTRLITIMQKMVLNFYQG